MSSDEESVEDDGLPDLGEYEGERNEREERHGQGRAKLPNGDTYEGSYENGKRHGKGIYRFKNGARYIGHYLDNKKNGEGLFYYPDGSKYEGYWVNDQRHGYGTYTYANKDIFEGEWVQNKRHGQGTYTYAETGSRFEGTWFQGRMQGSGQLVHANHRFVGSFTDDHPKGRGRYEFDLGCEQRGKYTWTEVEPDAVNQEDEVEPVIIPRWNGEMICHIGEA
ncbi:radial spoke head 1 homolog [Nematostella vectensis]|nr:radial spoke head 1 homolog [Nematostella vectensis]